MDKDRKVDTMVEDIICLKKELDRYQESELDKFEILYEIIYQAQNNPEDSMSELIKKAKKNWGYS